MRSFKPFRPQVSQLAGRLQSPPTIAPPPQPPPSPTMSPVPPPSPEVVPMTLPPLTMPPRSQRTPSPSPTTPSPKTPPSSPIALPAASLLPKTPPPSPVTRSSSPMWLPPTLPPSQPTTKPAMTPRTRTPPQPEPPTKQPTTSPVIMPPSRPLSRPPSTMIPDSPPIRPSALGGDETVVNNNWNENDFDDSVDVVNDNSNDNEVQGGGDITNNNHNVNRIIDSSLSRGDAGGASPTAGGDLPKSRIVNNNSNINRVFGGGDIPTGGRDDSALSPPTVPPLVSVARSVSPDIPVPEVESPPKAVEPTPGRPPIVRAGKLGGLEIKNNNSNVNYNAPHGVITNNNYVEMHVVSRDQLAEDLDTIEKGLERHHHVPQAVHDAQPAKDGCMKGTRVQLLADAKAHVTARGGPRIVWIAGMAGTGKTSTALTLCRMLCDDPTVLLGGTFFCSNTASAIERTSAQRIITTFATLLVRVIPDCAAALAAELRKDPDLAHKPISEQVQRLLVKPLDSLKSFDRQLVFVIDALDQCSDHQSLVDLVDAIADFKSSVPVKFLVASRPDPRIRKARNWDRELLTLIELHKLDRRQVTADIRYFIEQTFKSVAASSPWYTDDDLDHLATLADGLFVFSAVAANYIRERNPKERLNTVKTKISSSLATARLDEIYSLVLTQALDATVLEPAELDRTRKIIASIVSSRTPLQVKTLADLLCLTSEQLRDALDELHAVVFVPEQDEEGELRMLHPTFVDFLFKSAQAPIHIGKSEGHDALSEACIRRLGQDDLCFNVSRSRSSYTANPTIPIDWITQSLRYACLHWSRHVELASHGSDASIDSVLRRKLLFWLEALSVIGETRLAPELLRVAASVTKLPAPSRFLKDAISFVESSHEAIAFSAPHVYISAFPFAPKDSLVRQTFSSHLEGLVTVETIGLQSRNVGNINAVTVAPDGRVISSASEDGSLLAWDAEAREEIYSPMHGHAGEVHSVAISVDCRLTASASADKTVRIWDVGKGQPIGSPRRGHHGAVRAVAFSCDGRGLVSGSDDKTIRLWPTRSGGRGSSITCTSSVSSVAFSPDGRLVAAGGSSGAIQTFHTATGTPDFSIVVRDPDDIASLAFAPDGTTVLAARGNDIIGIDINSKSEVLTATGHTARVNVVTYSRDGQFIASGADDATVRLWDAKTGQSWGPVLYGHNGAVLSVTFSSVGQSVFSAGSDGTIRVWDLENIKSAGQHEQNPLESLAAGSYQDGWLLSRARPEERLLWVPPQHRQHFTINGHSRVIAAHHQHVVLVAEKGTLHLGEHWTRCWRPGSSMS